MRRDDRNATAKPTGDLVEPDQLFQGINVDLADAETDGAFEGGVALAVAVQDHLGRRNPGRQGHLELELGTRVDHRAASVEQPDHGERVVRLDRVGDLAGRPARTEGGQESIEVALDGRSGDHP